MRITINDFIKVYGTIVMYDSKVVDVVFAKATLQSRMEVLRMVTIPQKIEELFNNMTFVPWKRLKKAIEMVDEFGEATIPLALIEPLKDILGKDAENYNYVAEGSYLTITKVEK